MNPIEAALEGRGVGAPVAAALARYGRLVLEANTRLNLTAAKTPEEIAEHIADSLTLLPDLRPPYVDVGSGAGFPAIPLAIATGIEVTLIEATTKKARVLEELLGVLGLRGTVVPQRAEEAARDPRWRDHFLTGTCRAVATAAAVAELLLPLIAVDGVALLQRGRFAPSERASLEDAALVLGGAVEGERPAGGERRIVLVRKRTPTPARFPRRSGVPQRRPLCE
ncbi:MAG TPA: 16S rRNA (guanine(527)-N(7))-methyltransferase RsmG [Candidatus Cybelea sp.]|jgi:16S rRNA (guanine527-N7)-methyltransferase|nr:16S rRNA (guanine(527)-N(7))-methyltransferase RsmG [Candidatus Cybelea sp.]